MDGQVWIGASVMAGATRRIGEMRLGLLLLLTLAAPLALACSSSNEADMDAGIVFDARRPDALPEEDAGPGDEDAEVMSESDIGAACRSDMDCDGLCITDWTGGYCSNVCGDGTACPEGSACTPVGRGTSLCLASCDPTAEDPCRSGYGCTDDFRIGTVCIPGCTTDDDCPDGLVCDPDGGSGGAGACYDPEAEFGDACEEDTDCPASGFCLGEEFSGWPGSACIGFGCDPASGEGCSGDAVCVDGGRGGGICFDGCEVDDDCRDGYRCEPDETYPDRLSCRPGCTSDDQCSDGRVCNPALGTCDVPFDDGELGDPCSTVMGACQGGTCLSEFESGFPGSYCAFSGCTLGADAEDGCPGDGVCLEAGDANICVDGCETDDDCRAGYACDPVDLDDASRGTACLPACEGDADCANDGTDGAPDFSCNPGTGLCTDPFESARLGEPCEDLGDCPGGLCLSEAGDGWPAGTCASLGCRLSGDGPEAACAESGVCVDDETGDPEIGICLTACATATSGTCRPGYACVALSEGSEDGACRPACEGDDDCGGDRTCDTETGLCG